MREIFVGMIKDFFKYFIILFILFKLFPCIPLYIKAIIG